MNAKGESGRTPLDLATQSKRNIETAERCLERFVPAIARFLRERPVPIPPLRYEDLVSEPEAGMPERTEHPMLLMPMEKVS